MPLAPPMPFVRAGSADSRLAALAREPRTSSPAPRMAWRVRASPWGAPPAAPFRRVEAGALGRPSPGPWATERAPVTGGRSPRSIPRLLEPGADGSDAQPVASSATLSRVPARTSIATANSWLDRSSFLVGQERAQQLIIGTLR